MRSDRKLEVKLLSSLAKIFADEEPADNQWKQGSMLSNEVYAFQVAYHWSGELKKNVKIHINSGISPFITARQVGLVPSEMPCYADHDDNILRAVPGLYPDILTPPDSSGITLLPEQWRGIWITVNHKAEQIRPGSYPIEITFFDETTKSQLGKVEFELTVMEALLPKQTLLHTEWLHTDCIAVYYGVEVFSEEYWGYVRQFVQTAVSHGINMILTPLFTPPLDTEPGGERPTVQLVDVEKSQDRYSFNFERLKRWIELCRDCGVEFFEFSHLFTQWGARHSPKIIATVNGERKRIFGWDTDAGGEEYKSFLSQFLPALTSFIEDNNLEKSCYFHVSDEPKLNDFEQYKKASDLMHKFLEGYPIIDALSDYKFYETGVVRNPIPSTDHIEDFLENDVPDLWAYYCCCQYKQVANRFFNFPSARNRILGIQLYKFNIKGFLQWGYNFWFSQYSKHPIDPFCVTDSGYAFPSGDAFVVYPGKNGPLESLRLEVFFEALQDLRALNLLETLIGRDAVLNLLEEGLEYPITFSRYPKAADWILLKRELINNRIAKHQL